MAITADFWWPQVRTWRATDNGNELAELLDELVLPPTLRRTWEEWLLRHVEARAECWVIFSVELRGSSPGS